MIVRVCGHEVTGLLTSYVWSGSLGRIAREFDFSMAVSETDPLLPRVACPLGAPVTLQEEDGRLLFSGFVVARARQSGGTTMTLKALDRGMYLAGNDGFYNLNATPEAAVGRICRDFGFTAGYLAPTGVVVAQKFPGVPLATISTDLYKRAAEKTGKRYFLRFEGENLCVREKPTAATMTLAPGVNLISSAFSESIEKLRNSVAIYTAEGAKLRVVEDGESVQAFGRLQKILKQRKGVDAGAEARAFLEDNDRRQDVTVEILGDTSLTSGGAVTVVETGSGVRGLFWIDADKHSWKNHVPVTELGLNFRNLMG